MARILLFAAAFFSALTLTSQATIQKAAYTFHISFPSAVVLEHSATDQTSTTSATSSIKAVVKEASKSIVLIEGYKDAPVYSLKLHRKGYHLYLESEQSGTAKQAVTAGSGFFVTEDGYILTNKHVVSDTDADYLVTIDGDQYKAQIVYKDDTYDLAVLKIDASGFSPISFAATEPYLGEPVIAIGNALGKYIDLPTLGAIRGLDKTILVTDDANALNGTGKTAKQKVGGLIETSAKVYPGDSGGPLIDQDGNVIGVNVATAVGVRIGYAIPVDAAKAVLQKAGIH